MNSTNNKPERTEESPAKLTKAAAGPGPQFKFETLTAEELKKIRRNAYAYLL